MEDDQSLEKIKQIQAIMFKYNEKGLEFYEDGLVQAPTEGEDNPDAPLTEVANENTVQQLGFMAEEIEQVFPEIVDMVELENQEYRAVTYVQMIPVLLEAIKQLNKKVEDLEDKEWYYEYYDT